MTGLLAVLSLGPALYGVVTPHDAAYRIVALGITVLCLEICAAPYGGPMGVYRRWRADRGADR